MPRSPRTLIGVASLSAVALLAGGMLAACSSNTANCGASLEPWLNYTAQEVNTSIRLERVASTTASSAAPGTNPYELTSGMSAGAMTQAAGGLTKWAKDNSSCSTVAPAAATLATSINQVVTDQFADPSKVYALASQGETLRAAAGIGDTAKFYADGGSNTASWSPPPSS